MKTNQVLPDSASKESMWRLMETLFPRYRALCGPDYRDSLGLINNVIPLSTIQFPSGTTVNGWKVPKEFSVKEAWIENFRL